MSTSRLCDHDPGAEQSHPGWPLPPELCYKIVNLLKKSELKTLRIACKSLNAFAVPKLFDRVYVSLRRADLDVLANIAKNEHLRRHIHTLVVDMSIFPEFESLASFTTSMHLFATNFHEYFQSLDQDTTHPILHIADDVRLSRLVDVETLGPGDCEGWDQVGMFLKSAYAAVEDVVNQEMAAEEAEIREVVSRFPNIKHVKFDYRVWATTVKLSMQPQRVNWIDDEGHGPPFRKGWDPYHTRPYTSIHVDPRYKKMFFAVVRGLLQSCCKPLTLEGGLFHSMGISQQWLQELAKPETSLPFKTKFAGLQYLKLSIGCVRPAQNSGDSDMGVLPALLGALDGLRLLRLNLPTESARGAATFDGCPENCVIRFEDAFAEVQKFPCLHDLKLFGMKIRLSELSELFQICPAMGSLSIDLIELTDGTWEEALEVLSSRKLGTFSFVMPKPELKHRGVDFRPSGKPFKQHAMDEDLAKAIEKWIVGQGERPWL